MSNDDEELDTVEPSVSLLTKPGFVIETPYYGFEEDEEELDVNNEQKIIL